MEGLLASLHFTLPDGGAGWLHLVPSGTFRGRDGRGPYVLRDAEAVIRASMADGKLPIDEAHATDLAAPRGEPARAQGWITTMEARQDGIWGHVEWTPSGQKLIDEKAYRGVSPVFATTKPGGGEVTQIFRAALTNTPNLPDLATLHSRETIMDLTKLRAALGLPETADLPAIEAAAAAATAAIATHATTLTAIATAAGLTAAKPEAMVTELQAQRAKAVTPETVVGLQTELATLKAGAAKDRATAFVDAAIKAGKPINPVRDQYIAMHQADPVGVEKLIKALPSINAGGTHIVLNDAQDGDPDGLTPEDKMACQRMGLDPKKFAEQKKKRMGDADGGRT